MDNKINAWLEDVLRFENNKKWQQSTSNAAI